MTLHLHISSYLLDIRPILMGDRRHQLLFLLLWNQKLQMLSLNLEHRKRILFPPITCLLVISISTINRGGEQMLKKLKIVWWVPSMMMVS